MARVLLFDGWFSTVQKSLFLDSIVSSRNELEPYNVMYFANSIDKLDYQKTYKNPLVLTLGINRNTSPASVN